MKRQKSIILVFGLIFVFLGLKGCVSPSSTRPPQINKLTQTDDVPFASLIIIDGGPYISADEVIDRLQLRIGLNEKRIKILQDGINKTINKTMRNCGYTSFHNISIRYNSVVGQSDNMKRMPYYLKESIEFSSSLKPGKWRQLAFSEGTSNSCPTTSREFCGPKTQSFSPLLYPAGFIRARIDVTEEGEGSSGRSWAVMSNVVEYDCR